MLQSILQPKASQKSDVREAKDKSQKIVDNTTPKAPLRQMDKGTDESSSNAQGKLEFEPTTEPKASEQTKSNSNGVAVTKNKQPSNSSSNDSTKCKCKNSATFHFNKVVGEINKTQHDDKVKLLLYKLAKYLNKIPDGKIKTGAGTDVTMCAHKKQEYIEHKYKTDKIMPRSFQQLVDSICSQ